MKFYLIFFTLVLSIFAQDQAGVGYFSSTFQEQDMSSINTTLNDYGYGSVGNNFNGFGGGGYGQIGKILLGGEGYGAMKNGSNDGTYESEFSIGYGVFNIGYVLNSSKHLKIYPLIGFGGYGFNLTIKDKATSVDSILKGNQKNINLSQGGLLLQGSLGIDYLIDLNKNNEISEGILIGLRLGYLFSSEKNKWNDEELTGPAFALKGPFVKLVIGGGKF